jgi:hypothetical protein
MTPNEMMFIAQQYQAPQGILQVPKVGLLSVPDMSASYTDMSLSDEEMRNKLRDMGITLGADGKITPEMRMQVAGERLKEIPSNIMSVPGNVMDAAGSFAEGILSFFGK